MGSRLVGAHGRDRTTVASVRHGGESVAQMETSQLKNSIDNESNSPQYLVVESLPLLQLGVDFEIRAPFQGKNCSRRKLHASKEKGCQEKETLTVRETILRTK